MRSRTSVWRFRLAEDTPDDQQRFCALFNSLYTRKVDHRYYRWQFFEPPFPSILAFAEAPGGELAGCYGYHLLQWNMSRRPLAWALDIMISPRFQGSGLFRRLATYASACTEKYSPVARCVMANQRASRAHTLGLGWKEVGAIPTSLADTSGTLPQEPDVEVGVLRAAGTGEIPLCSSPIPGLAAVIRSESYMTWRFRSNPWYQYDFICFGGSSRPKAYVVTKVFSDPVTYHKYGDIVDYLWSPNISPSVLLNAALTAFRSADIMQAAFWLRKEVPLDSFPCWNLRQVSPTRYFCCSVLDTEYKRLSESRSWFLSMADSEIY